MKKKFLGDCGLKKYKIKIFARKIQTTFFRVQIQVDEHHLQATREKRTSHAELYKRYRIKILKLNYKIQQNCK